MSNYFYRLNNSRSEKMIHKMKVDLIELKMVLKLWSLDYMMIKENK